MTERIELIGPPLRAMPMCARALRAMARVAQEGAPGIPPMSEQQAAEMCAVADWLDAMASMVSAALASGDVGPLN